MVYTTGYVTWNGGNGCGLCGNQATPTSPTPNKFLYKETIIFHTTTDQQFNKQKKKKNCINLFTKIKKNNVRQWVIL